MQYPKDLFRFDGVFSKNEPFDGLQILQERASIEPQHDKDRSSKWSAFRKVWAAGERLEKSRKKLVKDGEKMDE